MAEAVRGEVTGHGGTWQPAWPKGSRRTRMWLHISPTLLLGMRNGTATLEDSLIVFYKTKRTSPYNPAVVLLGIYPKELKMCVHTKNYKQIFIAALS